MKQNPTLVRDDQVDRSRFGGGLSKEGEVVSTRRRVPAGRIPDTSSQNPARKGRELGLCWDKRCPQEGISMACFGPEGVACVRHLERGSSRE